MIVIPWETVSQPISTTTTMTTAGLTSSDCACLGSCTIPRPSSFRPPSFLSGRTDGRAAFKRSVRLGIPDTMRGEHMPSIHNKMFAFQFICMVDYGRGPVFWASIRCGWVRFGSVSSLAMCLHPFAVAYGTLIIVESSSGQPETGQCFCFLLFC